ncbi:uncharacterized protein EV420DRAFT_1644107 [Desarmillaria tabescens]|uniref:Uncharacterized protein n=1 Tax=Armillaria tabescens TaxID=1929756 RepID=A0AA39KCM2_ARMTA|nr:uncharacterized protein EV420DRAFT_1644107 [Desarmillaria tabescens]KAK0457359.1 hypothetical protein EV420DRAFT_1644107 [Desarmillaria tabescens]
MDDPAIAGDSMFLCKFAVECEIELSATIVRLGLQAIIRGICFLDWLVFLYNFFLHLLTRVKSVIFEGRGTDYRETDPPSIPCPFLLPPSVVKLRLKKVTLAGYSLEGLLSPDGRLQRLCIESLEEGAIPIPWSAKQRADIRESLSFNSFHGPFLLNPVPPTLRYIRLDLRSDAYNMIEHSQQIQPAGSILIGGYMLLHQLFSTPLARAKYDQLLDVGESYPFQTNALALQELNIRLGTHYNGEFAYVWPRVSNTLSMLTIHVPNLHTGGVVPCISLTGLNVLSTLNLYADFRYVGTLLKIIASWESPSKETATAVVLLDLVVSPWSQVRLDKCLSMEDVKQHFTGSAANRGIPFRGSFTLSLRDIVEHALHDPDYEHALSLISALSADKDIGLHHVECHRYHCDTLIS